MVNDISLIIVISPPKYISHNKGKPFNLPLYSMTSGLLLSYKLDLISHPHHITTVDLSRHITRPFLGYLQFTNARST